MSSTPTPRPGPSSSAPGAAASHAPPADRRPLDVGRLYLRAIRTHWLVATLFVAAVLAGSVLVLDRRSPTYEATAELLVSPVDPADTSFSGLSVVQELGDPTRTIQTAAALVENRDIAENAADRLGDPWTGDRVEDAITVSPQGQTNVLEIRASTDDGPEAAAVADAYAEAVVDVRGAALQSDVDGVVDRLQAQLATLAPDAGATRQALQQRVAELELLGVSGDPTVSPAETASVPPSSEGLSAGIVLAVALAAALVLAPGAALLVELAGPRRVRDEGDLADALAIPVLARVPPGRRRRTRSIPTGDAAQRAAYRALALHVEFARPRRRSLVVVSPSRGDGRTSVAANLAHELARSGAKVAVADLDPAVPDLAAALGAGPLSVLRVGPDQDGPDTGASASELVREASHVYDRVVVDTPPLLDPDEVLRLAAEADGVIVVVRRDRTLLRRLEAAGDLLVTVGAKSMGAVVVGAP